jgi:putative membrane protein
MRILLSILGNAAALYCTTVVPGITFTGGWPQLLLAGAIFGIFNFVIRPIAMFLSLPFLILTLGLFYFVVNGALLWAAQFVLPGYRVAGLWPAILGALVFVVVNWAIHALFAPGKKREG